jgi:hypothetical protein
LVYPALIDIVPHDRRHSKEEEPLMSVAIQPGAEVFRKFFITAHQYLEGTFSSVTDDILHWSPQPGPAPILAQYTHIVTSEDWLVNVKARGSAPLMATTFAGRTGFQTPPPITDWDKWARSEEIDLAQLRAYAQAVYQATDDFLSTTSDAFLNRTIDLSELHMGQAPAAFALVLAVSNCCVHTGEISALKGLCGLTGYPQ